MDQLIYDIGLHQGEDSQFYLEKGFRVIGVDADPDLCKSAAYKLRRFIECGRLQILNLAISDRPGTMRFFRSSKSDWGTVVPEWSEQNVARGYAAEEIAVTAVTLACLVAENGDPYYIKIDIEGMDRAALASLQSLSVRPRYISIESAYPRDATIESARADFAALRALGYDRFKIVAQHEVQSQIPPQPVREGQYVPFVFAEGASGMFGEEAPGEWVSLRQAMRSFDRIILKGGPEAALYKHHRLHRAFVAAKWRLTHRLEAHEWYDIHATRSAAPE